MKAEECQAVAAGFEAKKCLPNCLGAIACTHLKIRKPQRLWSEAYRDRTGLHSMVLQAVVDAHGNFLATSCGAFGSRPDSRVYDDSAFSGMVRKKCWLQTPTKRITYLSATTPPREVEYLLTPYILGDAAYTESLSVVVPYPGRDDAHSDTQKLFNCCHSSTRMTVEQAIGRLKGRWQFLWQEVGVNVVELPHFVNACIIMHNLCENEGMACDEMDVLKAEFDERRYRAGLRKPAGQEEEADAAEPDAGGCSQRRALADYLMHCKNVGRLHA